LQRSISSLPTGSLAPGDDFSRNLASTACRLSRCFRASKSFRHRVARLQVQGVSDFKTLLNGFSPPVMLTFRNINPSRSAAGRAGSVCERSMPDRSRSRARERAPDLPRFQGTRASAFESFAERRFSVASRQHHHDESVEVADLGLRHFFRGGVLVPLDYKLTPDEHWQLLKHSNATVLITEYPIWRQLSTSAGRASAPSVQTAGHGSTRKRRSSRAQRWKSFAERRAVFIARKRQDTACIVYSSGTGGRPKGCMMTHETI